MSDWPQLVAYWRTRLEENQSECAHGSTHLQWLRRAYIRVYRFLLSQYGEPKVNDAPQRPPAGEQGQQPFPTAAVEASCMALVDNTPDHRGRPPKSVGKIQNVLKGIHCANPRDDEPGPLAHGLPSAVWLTVASRRERWIPAECVRFLQQRGIPARRAVRGDDVVVEVARKDFESASHLLHGARPYLTDKNPAMRPGLHLLLGALAGGFVGMTAGSMFALFHLYNGGPPIGASGILLGSTFVGFLLGAMLGLGALLARWRATSRIAHRMTKCASAPSSTMFGGLLGAAVGTLIGFFFVPWLVVAFFHFPSDSNALGELTRMTTTLGLLCGCIIGCWIGFRDYLAQQRHAQRLNTRV
jgi:hypothetical protein